MAYWEGENDQFHVEAKSDGSSWYISAPNGDIDVNLEQYEAVDLALEINDLIDYVSDSIDERSAEEGRNEVIEEVQKVIDRL